MIYNQKNKNQLEFFTIKEYVTTETIEKKSRFIAILYPVETIEEVETYIKEIKKKYHDAKHHCIAYRILKEGNILEKANDNGEPSGTAGAPMLNILQKNNLCNILIIVIRYFGGILLGTGGLVRAYSESLLKTIDKSEIIQKCKGQELKITLDYNYFENFKYYCKNNQISITKTDYKENIICKIEAEEELIKKILRDYTTKKLFLKDIQKLSKKYVTKSI